MYITEWHRNLCVHTGQTFLWGVRLHPNTVYMIERGDSMAVVFLSLKKSFFNA